MADRTTLIFVPNDGSYVEILGHRIDGFENFEDFCEYLKKCAKLEEENKRLKSLVEEGIDLAKSLNEMIAIVRTETVKEFAERLKNKSKRRVSDTYGKRVFIEDIDNLVKEMAGESNG